MVGCTFIEKTCLSIGPAPTTCIVQGSTVLDLSVVLVLIAEMPVLHLSYMVKTQPSELKRANTGMRRGHGSNSDIMVLLLLL